jgi:hypothetical protein
MNHPGTASLAPGFTNNIEYVCLVNPKVTRKSTSYKTKQNNGVTTPVDQRYQSQNGPRTKLNKQISSLATETHNYAVPMIHASVAKPRDLRIMNPCPGQI